MAKRTSTKTLMIIGGGLALVGVGIYFLTRPSAPTTSAPALPITTTSGGSVVVYTDPASGQTYTRDQAAAVACRLKAIGHPAEAASWVALVTQHGGVLPC